MLKDEITFVDMSGLYSLNDSLVNYVYGRAGSLAACKWLNLRKLHGTDGYCDDEAQLAIKKSITDNTVSINSIHYIDNGNYHYLSKIFLDFMEKPFNLLVIDNHPDMQPPAFGDILSCGSWVREVISKNPYVNNVFLCGVNQSLITEEMLSCDRLIIADDMTNLSEMAELSSFPLYISIDKDALDVSDYRTNWDQGTLRAKTLASLLEDIIKKSDVCGIDICGGINLCDNIFAERYTYTDNDGDYDNIRNINLDTDIKLFDAIFKKSF